MFPRLTRRTVELADAVARQTLAEAKRFAPLETGGVLLGDARDETRPVVSELVGAGPEARRERHRFVPDGRWQRRQIAERYEASGRTLDYLGDWHSHPGGNGPSSLDVRTARKIANDPAARCRHPLFLIVTAVDGAWELRVYRLARRRFHRILVHVVPRITPAV